MPPQAPRLQLQLLWFPVRRRATSSAVRSSAVLAAAAPAPPLLLLPPKPTRLGAEHRCATPHVCVAAAAGSAGGGEQPSNKRVHGWGVGGGLCAQAQEHRPVRQQCRHQSYAHAFPLPPALLLHAMQALKAQQASACSMQADAAGGEGPGGSGGKAPELAPTPEKVGQHHHPTPRPSSIGLERPHLPCMPLPPRFPVIV